jgi:uncharacterized damage-inducible protein DinB
MTSLGLHDGKDDPEPGGPMTVSTDAPRNEATRSAVARSAERADLLETLQTHRRFLLQTVQGISDKEASQRTTVSELCLGGIIKHVAHVERGWAGFIVRGSEAITFDATTLQAHADSFRVDEHESLEDLIGNYEQAASQTDDLVRSVRSLDLEHPLPEAPWFEADGRWSVRRVVLHVVAEIAQHAGHADIIREALDGSKTMG